MCRSGTRHPRCGCALNVRHRRLTVAHVDHLTRVTSSQWPASSDAGRFAPSSRTPRPPAARGRAPSLRVVSRCVAAPFCAIASTSSGSALTVAIVHRRDHHRAPPSSTQASSRHVLLLHELAEAGLQMSVAQKRARQHGRRPALGEHHQRQHVVSARRCVRSTTNSSMTCSRRSCTGRAATRPPDETRAARACGLRPRSTTQSRRGRGAARDTRPRVSPRASGRRIAGVAGHRVADSHRDRLLAGRPTSELRARCHSRPHLIEVGSTYGGQRTRRRIVARASAPASSQARPTIAPHAQIHRTGRSYIGGSAIQRRLELLSSFAR